MQEVLVAPDRLFTFQNPLKIEDSFSRASSNRMSACLFPRGPIAPAAWLPGRARAPTFPRRSGRARFLAAWACAWLEPEAGRLFFGLRFSFGTSEGSQIRSIKSFGFPARDGGLTPSGPPSPLRYALYKSLASFLRKATFPLLGCGPIQPEFPKKRVLYNACIVK